MNTIISPQKNAPPDEQASSEVTRENIYPYLHELNITDGGEFLDDGIRMKDQPFGETTTKEKENK